MIQAGPLQKPRYAYRLMPGHALGARVVRAEQSAAASALLEELRAEAGPTDGPSSKAHSRALAAAAVVRTGRVGVDVEFHAPGRRIEAVARWLMGADAPDVGAAYRVFTFYEAYFKAIGEFPKPEAMRVVAGNTDASGEVAGVQFLHRPIEEMFTLTLVWSAA